jgi:hypothetical protein
VLNFWRADSSIKYINIRQPLARATRNLLIREFISPASLMLHKFARLNHMKYANNFKKINKKTAILYGECLRSPFPTHLPPLDVRF